MLRTADKRINLGQALPEPGFLRRRSPAEWYGAYIRSLSPVAYWPMQEASGLPQDVSGNANHMTAVNGSPTYRQAGPLNTFGINYPSTAYHERAVVSTQVNDFTVVFWMRRDGATTSGGDIFTHGSTSGGFAVEYSNTAGAVRGNLPGVGTLGSLGTLTDQTWAFVAFGKQSGAGGTVLAGFNGSYLSLGTAAPGTPAGNDRVNGQAANGTRIAHVAIFNRWLTAGEVGALYQIGQGTVIPL